MQLMPCLFIVLVIGYSSLSVQAAENVTEIKKKIRHDGEYLETVELLAQKS